MGMPFVEGTGEYDGKKVLILNMKRHYNNP